EDRSVHCPRRNTSAQPPRQQCTSPHCNARPSTNNNTLSLHDALPIYNGVDSYFGGDTEDAVRRFQSYYGLTVDGLAGKKTYDKLGGKPAKKKASKSSAKLPSGVLRRGDRGEKVKRLQRALNKANLKVGKVDGIDGARPE